MASWRFGGNQLSGHQYPGVVKLLSRHSFPSMSINLNALMVDEGYQMRESMPAVTTLTAVGASGGTLRQAFAGEWTLTINNTGVVRANNLNVSLSGFTAAPDQASGPDFFESTVTGDNLQRHRAFLENGQSTTLTLRWNELPEQGTISFQVAVRSDEGEVENFAVELTLLPSFRQFVSGLDLQGEFDDEDQDGVGNLLEYALGGDVQSSSSLTPLGIPLGVNVNPQEEQVEISFLRRTDLLERGLAYQVFHSEDLLSWDPTSLDDSVVSSDDVDAGFQKVSLLQDSTAASEFFVLRVTLDEDPAE